MNGYLPVVNAPAVNGTPSFNCAIQIRWSYELIHLRDLYNFRIQTRTVNRKYDVNQMELMSVQ